MVTYYVCIIYIGKPNAEAYEFEYHHTYIYTPNVRNLNQYGLLYMPVNIYAYACIIYTSFVRKARQRRTWYEYHRVLTLYILYEYMFMIMCT